MKVTIPDREWYQIAGAAERSGKTVAELLTEAVEYLAGDRTPEFREQVAHLVDQGIPDPVIAHRLRATIGHVAAVRRSMKLKPNRFRREQWEHELKGGE